MPLHMSGGEVSRVEVDSGEDGEVWGIPASATSGNSTEDGRSFVRRRRREIFEEEQYLNRAKKELDRERLELEMDQGIDRTLQKRKIKVQVEDSVKNQLVSM